MEGLLTNNIFFIYLLGVLVIINYEAFQKEQKIAIIYACSFGLTFNGELHENLFIHLWQRVKQLFSFRNFRLAIKKKNKFKMLVKYSRKVFNKIRMILGYKFCAIKRKVRGYIRGYSTIEMQLIRILAYKKGLKVGRPKEWKGLYLIATRKIYEVIYAPIFFSGHKDYLNITKEKDFYRYYLVYIYLHTVQTNLNGRVFAPLDRIFGDVDVIDWPEEALFIIILGLNGMKITQNRVNTYTSVIDKYQLNREVIDQLVDCIS